MVSLWVVRVHLWDLPAARLRVLRFGDTKFYGCWDTSGFGSS